MSQELFEHAVKLSVDYGIYHFRLTPLVGEVFMDPGFFSKLHYLESNPNVSGYDFHSNFSLIHKNQIEELLRFKKLTKLVISIYGGTEDEFREFTRTTGNVYTKIVDNINYLSDFKESRVEFKLKLTIDARGDFYEKSDLLRAVKRCILNNNSMIHLAELYDNFVGEADITNRKFPHLKPRPKKVRTEQCPVLQRFHIVLWDGTFNACCCRDVNKTLQLGNIQHTTFENIYNQSDFKNLLLEIPDVCQICTRGFQ